MKKLIIVLTICIIYAISTSCEEMFGDFLDKAPGVDVTQDTIFSSVTQVETFLTACYENGFHSGYGYSGWRYGSEKFNGVSSKDHAYHWAASCDECDYTTAGFPSNQWNSGAVVPVRSISGDEARSGIDHRYYVRWTALRMIYTMLDRVDDVPGISPDYATQIKGEMKFFIALNYLEMFKRYGGVPIITRTFKIDENIKTSRNSADSVVNFIVQNCDEAAAVLPDAWPSNWKGRITKGAALACKARILLYAASPLWNTASPYISMPNPDDNRLICFGNYDHERWKKAADAAKAVLDWAPLGSIQLVTNQGTNKNYRYVWEVMDNSEIIQADKIANGGFKGGYAAWVDILPRPFGGWSGTTVTQSFIERFYDKRDGNPQTWAATGTDLNQKYADLDYRFAQSVGYNGLFWNTQRGNLQLFQGGTHVTNCLTGYWTLKFIPSTVNNQNSTTPVNWPHFRLAEFYLSYAEALNEYNSSPPQEAYDAINAIRARSGMPNIPAGLTKDQFRDRIVKEWAIEYFLEDRRFWDIRRWMIGEVPGIMSGPFYGLTITKGAAGPPQQYTYTRYAFENRSFPRKFYLHPFFIDEVNKGYLKQNPGW